MDELAAACCLFWNKRAVRFRAFEEYYPWEEGYPPLAFSSLAVAKLVAAGVVDGDEVRAGLEAAARQLSNRFERQAANQQVAGMAALIWVSKVAPGLVDGRKLASICDRTLLLQHKEGWYPEYGGPDLGYLSVAMDCLWDAFDATGDFRFKASAERALEFMLPFMALPGRGAGMHNARNTDYIVPYGIARFLDDPVFAEKASWVISRLQLHDMGTDHFLMAVDDRYLCHYIGHSIFRAVPLLANVECGGTYEGPEEDKLFGGSGHWIRRDGESGSALLVSSRKGGVLTWWTPCTAVSDYGWIAEGEGCRFVSHWWSDTWQFDRNGDMLRIRGFLVPHREILSSPIKHLLLRMVSFLFGCKVIGLLKERLIFRKRSRKAFRYERKVSVKRDAIVVEDAIDLRPGLELLRAPRASKRHVASADCSHREDFHLRDPGVCVSEERRISAKHQQTIITTYTRNEAHHPDTLS